MRKEDKEKKYCRVSGSNKAHILDISTGRPVCGSRLCGYIKRNKTEYGASEMLEKHHAIAKRRGYPNPYKFCCQKCGKNLAQLFGVDVKKIRKEAYEITEEQKERAEILSKSLDEWRNSGVILK